MIRRVSYLAALALIVALGVYDAPVAAEQTATAPPAVSEFDVRGLKVLVKRRAGSPTVSAGLFIRGGSRNVTAANAGIEALMLSVATEASANFPLERFRRELARTGTVVDSGINRDYSAFTLACTRRFFDRAWELFADAALRPSFAEADFQRVKNQYLAGLSGDQDTPDAALEAAVEKVVYKNHPYANDPHGTVESVSKLSVADMRRFHQQVMVTSRLLLVIVGDLDPADVQRRVATAFASVPQGSYTDTPAPALTFSAPALEVTPRPLPTNYIRGVYAAPAPGAPDYYPLLVANSVLGDRIFTEVRQRRALSYAPDAFLREQSVNVGGIYVTAVDANEAVRVMLDEIEDLQDNDISPDEITATAQQFLTNYYVAQQTNAAQVGSLAEAELVGGGWRTEGNLVDRLRAVRPADVRRVATRYMRNLQFAVLGNPQAIDRRVFLR